MGLNEDVYKETADYDNGLSNPLYFGLWFRQGALTAFYVWTRSFVVVELLLNC